MKNILSTFLICLLAFAGVAKADNTQKMTGYFVTNHAIRVFDTSSDKIIGNVNLSDDSPYQVAVSQNGKVAYAILWNTQTVAVIDTLTHKQIGIVNNLSKNQDIWRHGLTVAPNGQFAYVIDYDDELDDAIANPVYVIDTSTHSVVDAIKNIAKGTLISSVFITPDSQKALMISYHFKKGDSILFVDTKSQSVTNTLSLTNRIISIVFTPDSKKAYLLDYNLATNENNLLAVNLLTQTIEKNINLGLAETESLDQSLAISPDGKKVYVLLPGSREKQSSVVDIIDTASDTLISAIRVNQPKFSLFTKIAISADGKKGYLSAEGGDAGLTIIDLATTKVISQNEDIVDIYDMVFFGVGAAN